MGEISTRLSLAATNSNAQSALAQKWAKDRRALLDDALSGRGRRVSLLDPRQQNYHPLLLPALSYITISVADIPPIPSPISTSFALPPPADTHTPFR